MRILSLELERYGWFRIAAFTSIQTHVYMSSMGVTPLARVVHWQVLRTFSLASNLRPGFRFSMKARRCG